MPGIVINNREKKDKNFQKNTEEQLQLQLNKKLITYLLQNKSEDEIINFLETSDVDVNYFNNEFNPLFQLIESYKIQNSNDKLIYNYFKILINYGANFNIVWRNDKIPLFEILKIEIYFKVLRYCKEHGVNMYQIDKEGRNLLMYALENRADINFIKYLFSLNYNLNQQDNKGNTVYMYATIYYNSNTYNKVLPYLLKNFRYNSNIIITLILMGKNKKAVKNNEILNIIKSNNQLINKKNNDGDTALLIAIRTYRQMKILSFLIQLGSRIDVVDKNGSSALMVAAESKNFKAFKFILDFHPDLNFKNNNNDTPLIMAAKSNDAQMVKLLLHYREMSSMDKKRKYYLRSFIEKYFEELKSNESESTNSLLSNTSTENSIDENSLVDLRTLKVNECNNDGDTALSIAVKNNNREMIYNLAINGADFTIYNNKKESPLSIAAQSSDVKTVELILNLQENINELNINNETPLVIALKFHNYAIAKKLIEKGADITIRDNNYRTALMIAACDNNANEIVEEILKNSVNDTLRFRDKEGKSALLLAFENNCIDNVKSLLKKFERNNILYEVDNKKNNAIILASKVNSIDVINFIFDEKNNFNIDINSQNKSLNTALMKASKKGYTDVVKCLIEKRANLEMTNKDGNTALLIACINNQLNVVKILLSAGANLECVNKEGITPVIAASKNNNIELLKLMLSNNDNKRKPKINCDDPMVKEKIEDCFIDCVENGHYDVVKMLLNEGIKIDVSCRNNTFYKLLSSLIVATSNGQCKIINEILTQSQFKEVLEEFRHTRVLIHACKNLKKKMVELLLKLNVDVNVVDDHGNTALIEASKNPYLSSCVKELIKRKANLNAINDDGTSALLNSCKIKDDKIFKYLIDHKANIYISDHEGNNALMYACLFGDLNKVKYLVKKRININAVNNDGNTALILAVREANLNIVKYLIKHKADVNILNRKGQNALIVGFIKSYTEDEIVHFTYITVIKLLIEKGTDLNVPIDSTGNTVLMFLIMNDDFNMIKYIFENSKNIDVNQKNHLGHNAFTYALKCNNTQIIDYLIQKKVDIHEEDDYGNDMIMYSTCSVKLEYFKRFIKDIDKENINKCNHSKETYLIMATKMNNGKVIKALLEKGADPNLQDSQGNTALHFASVKGDVTTVKKLLDYHADIEIKNSSNETPVMVACRFKQPGVIKLLLDQGANTICIDNYIFKSFKSFDFKEDQDNYVNLLIENYAEMSDVFPKDYLSTKTLLERMIMFYSPATFKYRFEGIEEHITDGLEEFAELIFDTITGKG